MSFDEELAERLRGLLAVEDGVVEKKMFGGVAFMLGGHLTIAASGQGGILVRIDPDSGEAALARPFTEPMVMKGRELAGWIRVQPEGYDADDEVQHWVDEAVAFVRTLPPQ